MALQMFPFLSILRPSLVTSGLAQGSPYAWPEMNPVLLCIHAPMLVPPQAMQSLVKFL